MQTATTSTLLAAAVSFALADGLAAQQILRSIAGDQPGANFGRTLAVVSDIDGDGTPDLVIGEPMRDSGSNQDVGSAVLLRTGAWVVRARTVGSQILGRLGSSVAGLGDVDGDQIPDWACGSPGTTFGVGPVRILSGATGLVLHEFQGPAFSEFGAAICAIGDRNSDGRADFAIGVPGNPQLSPNSEVRFYSGANGALLATLTGSAGTRFGRSLLTLGDLNGDGQPEIAIGQPLAATNGNAAGQVLVKNPRDGLENSWVWTAGTAFAAGQEGGTAMTVLGDVNQDGRPDLLVAGRGGALRVLSGASGTVLYALDNPEFGDAPSLAGIGDWDADGFLDFAVGAPTAAFGNGRVFVHSCRPGLPLLANIQGPPNSAFGAALAALGDLNGDGRPEFAVGAPTFIRNGLLVGRVSVHAFDIPPQTNTFGQGCAGTSGVPSLYFAGAPNLGQSFDILCANLRINTFGYLVYGFSDSSTGLFPLPLSMTPFGLPGCTLYVAPDAPEPFVTTNSTLLTRSMLLPNVPSLATFRFFVQACQFDPAAVGGINFSNAGSVRVGNL